VIVLEAAKFWSRLRASNETALVVLKKMSKTTKNQKIKKERKVNARTWVRQVLAKYDVIEERQPQTFNLAAAEWPAWVFKLWQILLADFTSPHFALG